MTDQAVGDLSCVYFIESPAMGAVKIGKTQNLKSRMAELQTGCPDPLVLKGVWLTDDAGRLEREMHTACRGSRLRGEWFRIGPEVSAVMDLARLPRNDGVIVRFYGPEVLDDWRGRAERLPGESAESLANRAAVIGRILGEID